MLRMTFGGLFNERVFVKVGSEIRISQNGREKREVLRSPTQSPVARAEAREVLEVGRASMDCTFMLVGPCDTVGRTRHNYRLGESRKIL